MNKSPRGPSAANAPAPCTTSRPIVCIAASRQQTENGRHRTHATGERNVDAVQAHAGCMPLILPALSSRLDVDELVAQIDGLVLTGGRANVEPHHYDGPPFPDDEPIDPDRDGTVLPLVQACINAQIPIFGICRGIQEMNVALGGSLHYRVHLLEGKEDHRMPRHEDVTVEEIFKLRHRLALTPGGLFETIVGSQSVMTNSLHGQGIDRLADNFEIEAISDDGVIEGIRLKNDPSFTVGVQWHAEYEPENHDLSRRLFELFGEQARRRASERVRKLSLLLGAA